MEGELAPASVVSQLNLELEDEKTSLVPRLPTYRPGVRTYHISVGLLLLTFQKHVSDLVSGPLPCINLGFWLCQALDGPGALPLSALWRWSTLTVV